MKCHICDSETKLAFTKLVLKKYNVMFYQCSNCYYIQSEEPYWLDEAYNSALNIDDTGILKRNTTFHKKTLVIDYFIFNHQKEFLDFAGGYGVFTRLMRDAGFDYYWTDKYAQNILARGFEDNGAKKYESLTAFEVFEHIVNPKEEIGNMLKFSDSIIFTTLLIDKSYPDPDSWWYYGFHHGQHVSFYTFESLNLLSKQFGLNYYSDGINFHLFTKKKLSNLYFKLLLKFSKYGLDLFVRMNLKSKTDSDSNLLKTR